MVSGLMSLCEATAAGRSTFTVRIFVMLRLTSMNEARRKNMMSIRGMISSRDFFCGRGERSFMSSGAGGVGGLEEFDISGGHLQIELQFGEAGMEVVQWNERGDGNAETGGSGDEGFADAAGNFFH